MKRRWGLMVLIVFIIFLPLIGCGNRAESTKQHSMEDGGLENESETEEEMDRSHRLKVYAFSGGYGQQMWKEVAEAFEKIHKDVKVELVVDSKIEELIELEIKKGEIPDVIHCPTGRKKGFTEEMAKARKIEALSDVIQGNVLGENISVEDKILSGFLDTLGTNPYGDDVSYFAPMFYSPCGLFYNAALLDSKGWDLPQNWEEMWELGEKAKKEGIFLFTYPTVGYFDAFIFAMLESSGGMNFYNSAMMYKDGLWETKEAKNVLEIVAKLSDYIEPSTLLHANETDFIQNQQLILDNKALFCPNGTWLPEEMKDAKRAEGFTWGFTPIPAVASDKRPSSFTFIEQMWIPVEAENKQLAKEWIAFMYSDIAADIFMKSNAIQPILGISNKLENENRLFYRVYDNAMAVMGGFAATDGAEREKTMKTVLFDAIHAVMKKEKTVDEWAKEIEEVNDKLRLANQE